MCVCLTLYTCTQLDREKKTRKEYHDAQTRERRKLDEARIDADPALGKLKLTKEERGQAFEKIINHKEDILDGKSLVEWAREWEADLKQVASKGGDYTVQDEHHVAYAFNTCQPAKRNEV